MADDTPDPQRLLRLARQTMSSAERRQKYRRIDFLDANFWYPTQLAFFAAGSKGVHQRLIYGGNQSGKTLSCGAETYWHLSGDYPAWWNGKRYPGPIRSWGVGESGMLVRDTMQRKLCGDVMDADGGLGSGLIPLEMFARKLVMVPGGTGAVDTLYVRHVSGGVSSLTFRTFEMRREKLQGESVHLIWIDERPPENVYNELLARTSATDGHLIVSYTPVGAAGAAGVTYKFLTDESADRAAFRIPGSEVKHISETRRAELAAEYGDAERETRLEGVPQLGAGPIFPVELLPVLTKTFDPDKDLPSWARWCVGIDFGFAGGFAAVEIAWAHDIGDIWVIDSFMMQQSSALYHVQRIHSMTRGLRVPVAWPHDGHVHDKGTGLALSTQYKNFGANMLPTHATNYGAGDYRVEPGLQEIREAMFAGKFHIAGHNTELIEQLRHYHRDENYKVVKSRDHLIDALRYAVMMKRSGKPRLECQGVGYGAMPYAGHRPESRHRTQRNDRWDLFTGEPLD